MRDYTSSFNTHLHNSGKNEVKAVPDVTFLTNDSALCGPLVYQPLGHFRAVLCPHGSRQQPHAPHPVHDFPHVAAGSITGFFSYCLRARSAAVGVPSNRLLKICSVLKPLWQNAFGLVLFLAFRLILFLLPGPTLGNFDLIHPVCLVLMVHIRRLHNGVFAQEGTG
jgi:hypothetical protein